MYLAAVVVGYAFSLIDLIPGRSPILGYLNDLIPPRVLAGYRENARAASDKPVNRVAVVVVVAARVALAVFSLAR